jgi:hypothetical protein
MRFSFVLSHLWHGPLGVMRLSVVPKAQGHDVFLLTGAPEHIIEQLTGMLLAHAGCHMVSLGIKTGSADKRQKLLRRAFSHDQIVTVCKDLHANGTKVLTLNMLGVPGELSQQALKTLGCNLLCKQDYAWAAIHQPYSATALGQTVCDSGLYGGNPDIIPLSLYDESALTLHPDHLRKEVLRLQRLLVMDVHFPWLGPFITTFIHLLESAYTVIWRGLQDRAHLSIMGNQS